MNLIKILNFLFLLFFSISVSADNHNLDLNKNTSVTTSKIETEKTVKQEAKKEETLEDELNNVPLNNPFGGGVSSSGGSVEQSGNNSQTNSISALQGRKLVGIIESSRKRFALFQNANGSIQIISENDYLTKNLFIREIDNEIVLIEDQDKKVFEVAFNNFIRPMEGN